MERSQSDSDALVVLVSTPSEEEALRIARCVVEERLAAAANVVPGVRSFYRWQGRVADASEAIVVAKTRRARVAALIERVEALHSYQVPSIIAVPVERASTAYLEWIAASTPEGGGVSS